VARQWPWHGDGTLARQGVGRGLLYGPAAQTHSALLFILNFQTHSNLQWIKIHLPLIQKFHVKCVFVGNYIMNNFPYWNFSKFKTKFELEIWEALWHEFE
jgi:hypothetical protein